MLPPLSILLVSLLVIITALLAPVASSTSCTSTNPVTLLALISYSNCVSSSAVTISSSPLSLEFISSTFAGLSMTGAFSSFTVTLTNTVFTGMSSGETIVFTGALSSGTLLISGCTFSTASGTAPLVRFMSTVSSYSITSTSSTFSGSSEVFRHEGAVTGSTTRLSSTQLTSSTLARGVVGSNNNNVWLLDSSSTVSLTSGYLVEMLSGTSTSMTVSIVGGSSVVAAAALVGSSATSISSVNVVISGTSGSPVSITAGSGVYCYQASASCSSITMTGTYASIGFTSGGALFGVANSVISSATVTFASTVTMSSIAFAAGGTVSLVSLSIAPSSASWASPTSLPLVTMAATSSVTGLTLILTLSSSSISIAGSDFVKLSGTISSSSVTLSGGSLISTGSLSTLISVDAACALTSTSIIFSPTQIDFQQSTPAGSVLRILSIGSGAVLQASTVSISGGSVSSFAASTTVTIVYVSAMAKIQSSSRVSILSWDLRRTTNLASLTSIAVAYAEETSIFDSSFLAIKCVKFPSRGLVPISFLVRVSYVKSTAITLDSTFAPVTTFAGGVGVAFTNASSVAASSTLLLHRSNLHFTVVATDVRTPTCLSSLQASCTRSSPTTFVAVGSFASNLAAVSTQSTLVCSGTALGGAECGAPFAVSTTASLSLVSTNTKNSPSLTASSSLTQQQSVSIRTQSPSQSTNITTSKSRPSLSKGSPSQSHEQSSSASRTGQLTASRSKRSKSTTPTLVMSASHTSVSNSKRSSSMTSTRSPSLSTLSRSSSHSVPVMSATHSFSREWTGTWSHTNTQVTRSVTPTTIASDSVPLSVSTSHTRQDTVTTSTSMSTSDSTSPSSSAASSRTFSVTSSPSESSTHHKTVSMLPSKSQSQSSSITSSPTASVSPSVSDTFTESYPRSMSRSMTSTQRPTASLLRSSTQSQSNSASPSASSTTSQRLSSSFSIGAQSVSPTESLDFFLASSNFNCDQQSRVVNASANVTLVSVSSGANADLAISATIPSAVPLLLILWSDSRYRCIRNSFVQIPASNNRSVVQCLVELVESNETSLISIPIPTNVSISFLFEDGTDVEQLAIFPASSSSPIIAALSGCPSDVFPNALGCPNTNTSAITMHGSGFTTDMFQGTYQVEWVLNGWTVATCQQAVVASWSSATCESVSVNVTAWMLAVNTATAPSSAPGAAAYSLPPAATTLVPTNAPSIVFPAVTLSVVVASSEFTCPNSTSEYQCSGHGICDKASGLCACTSDPTDGFWSGASCTSCASTYNASAGCTALCPVASDGSVCGGSSLGFCGQGMCYCADTSAWFNGTCVLCPRSTTDGSICSSRGACHLNKDGNGNATSTCVCAGNFTGDACESCASGYSGVSCNKTCPLGSNGTSDVVCSGHGACSDGNCYCVPEYCGVNCSAFSNSSLCDSCPEVHLFGPSCNLVCPGTAIVGGSTSVCSGHGQCSNGVVGSGLCYCSGGFGRADCSGVCPTSSMDGTVCSGHGSCSQLTAQCVCATSYAGVACSVQCPTSSSGVCSGHGVCNDGSLGSGVCTCTVGYGGSNCSSRCPGPIAAPCNLNGECSTDGQSCLCYNSSTRGHWRGSVCDVCASGWSGAGCASTCSVGLLNGLVCSGHGTCSSLECNCFASLVLGFWSGATCSQCAAGYYGASCLGECPGGACTPCSGHGVCSDGLNGTGTCTCDASSSLGYWTASDCHACSANVYGVSCTSNCSNCGPFGVCSNGTTGNGLCSCTSAAYAMSAGVCSQCSSGYYGVRCDPCPRSSSNGLTCNGTGTCSDGIQGTGLCQCPAGTGGAACDQRSCPMDVNGVVCGRGGSCNTTTFNCSCTSPRYIKNATTGTCSSCAQGWFGANCTSRCSMCAFGECSAYGTSCLCYRGYWGVNCTFACPGGTITPCSGHGSCDSLSGVCQCTQSITDGYYSGASCNSCSPRYNSTGCNIPCCNSCSPRYNSTGCNIPCPSYNGAVCSGRGSCFNGVCSQCKPAASEVGLIVYACGDACQLIDQQCDDSSSSGACPYGSFGSNCTSMCPGVTSLPAAAGTSCSNNGYCDGTGSCTCAGYAYGPACASYCQPQLSHNASVVCSGRGYCSGTGACTCYEGYYNTTCQSRCPQYLNQTCGGRGVCACELDCPGGATSPCYGRGLCGQDNATCNCFQSAAAGYFSGFSCESCSTLFTGPSCTVYCNPNFGTINGTSCVCTFGRCGISCDNLCPRGSTNQLVCSGHGVCDSVAGSCACSSNYYGTACDVLCSVAICQAAGMYRPQCDTNNGSCVCKNSETGHWTGALCNTCASDRWGDECNLACSCNGHGSCNSWTGACICYNDNVQGHYSGTTCAVCDSKYFGSQCLNLNLNYSPASTVIVSLGAQVASLWAAVHRSDGIIVYGSSSDSALRVCTLIPANGSVACSVATAPSPSLSGFFLTTGPFSSSLVVLTLNGSAMNLVFESNGTVVGHDLLTSSSDVSPTASRTFSQLSASGNPQDLQSVHYVPVPNATVAEQSYCYVGLPINSSASNASATAQLSCLNASTFLPTRSLNISLASPWDAIVSVFWSTDRRQLAIVGCMNGCHSWVATIVTLNVTTTTEAAAIRGVVSVHTYENPSLTDSSLLACTSINVANFTLICSTQESTNEGLYLWSLTINSAAVLTATPSPLVVAQVYSGQLFASVNLSALSVLMTAEEEAQLAYVAFTPPYDFPIVLVLDAQTLQLNSIHSLTSFPSGVVATLSMDPASMDPANRLLIGSLYDAQGGLNVFTINLFSVSSVLPGVVDAVGGATLTISGYGFVGDV
ncbi:GPI-anchored surface protein, putative [Bodo saltans]|uniref:GPI-anchored surface protein, putative n=1 Tax=Bodo saltans TaxID=75058 RepID=A0A0S4IQB9_BODSA|nr:GPI-anchored surface protein, putative [Bodo saltans]|eukprot:CUF94873.1 GPI-anchored surface protein, putative [Bodo saltans]